MKKDAVRSVGQLEHVAPLVRGALDSKGKGELGELAFVLKAASLGFGVAKPYGENERYDYIVDSGERLWKVQVKSTYTGCGRGYRTLGRRGNAKGYKAGEIDFLVAYIVPLDLWYVIPVSRVLATIWVAFYPSGCSKGGFLESYREAWDLMAPGPSPSPVQSV
jgi:hypothetical protein